MALKKCILINIALKITGSQLNESSLDPKVFIRAKNICASRFMGSKEFL